MPRGITHPPERVLRALALRQSGDSVSAIAREVDLPRGTVARWCRGLLPADAAVVAAGGFVPDRCDVCGRFAHSGIPVDEYAYLLGIHLGDGSLGPAGRTVALRIALDSEYPGIIDEVRRAILAVRRERKVSAHRLRNERCVSQSYTRAWRCLFPQHGAGLKHLRPIRLEPWQEQMVRRKPGRFVRGLIHSDGWRGLNRVRVKSRDYAYPRYQFSNRSADIRRLFTDACDELGVEWRPWGRYHISVARRASVAILDEHVGPKR